MKKAVTVVVVLSGARTHMYIAGSGTVRVLAGYSLTQPDNQQPLPGHHQLRLSDTDSTWGTR